MIALLKYGSGLPFHRLEGLQETLGIPLPASTQWDIVHTVAGLVEPAFDELIRQAAQGQVLHNDDTTVKILEFMGKRARKEVRADADGSPDTVDGHAVADHRTEAAPHDDPPRREPPPGPVANRKAERSGLFTSGIVSTREGRRIALFFSGRQHAGENLADVLAHRAGEPRRRAPASPPTKDMIVLPVVPEQVVRLSIADLASQMPLVRIPATLVRFFFSAPIPDTPAPASVACAIPDDCLSSLVGITR